MNASLPQSLTEAAPVTPALTPSKDAREWVRVLAQYREPNTARSLLELTLTLLPFFTLWGAAWAALTVSPFLSLAIAVLNGFFLVRLFVIQHDCGHGSFLANRRAMDWVGRSLGVLTVTPYMVWRHSHSIHHSAAGNLEQRGIGDINTLTLNEYRDLSRFGRFGYHLYRNPLFMFGVVPAYLFLFQHRIPLGYMTEGKRFWISTQGSNLATGLLIATIVYFGGWQPIFWIFIPTVIAAATLGMWLFYVQHQFEDTHWDHDVDWQLHEAALHGSSFYDLPQPFRWLSANIGVHHVHHLYSRIPFYRLMDVIRDHPELAEDQRMTLGESLVSARLHIWNEDTRKLLSFKDARALL
ncbi:MAG: fatty acid desaturase [Pseudoruegeria sp.]